jgi:hypothetical protein
LEKPRQAVPIAWRRLLIHLTFLALAYYVTAESLDRLFGDTPLAERGSSRASPLTLVLLIIVGTASWLFNLLYPAIPPNVGKSGAADQDNG